MGRGDKIKKAHRCFQRRRLTNDFNARSGQSVIRLVDEISELTAETLAPCGFVYFRGKWRYTDRPLIVYSRGEEYVFHANLQVEVRISRDAATVRQSNGGIAVFSAGVAVVAQARGFSDPVNMGLLALAAIGLLIGVGGTMRRE